MLEYVVSWLAWRSDGFTAVREGEYDLAGIPECTFKTKLEQCSKPLPEMDGPNPIRETLELAGPMIR